MDVAPRIDELVARACRRAGLDDFGDDSWREGLTLLVATVESSPGVSPGGRDLVYGQFVDALWNRLRIVDYLKQHREVSAERIERPLVVLGLPRTGTSLASYLLDQDPQRRSLLTWEAENSVPPATPETLRTDPRCLKKKAELDLLAQGLKAANIPMVHWDEADGPTECMFVQNQDFKAYLWEAFMPTSAYADWLLEAGTGHLVTQDAVARCTHRGAAGDIPRRAYRVGPPRSLQGHGIVPPVELPLAVSPRR